MPKRVRVQPYVQIFLTALEQLVIIPDRLTRTELRLWLLLIAHCEWQGGIDLSQRAMSSILGVSETQVSVAMRVLLDEGLVLRERPDRGRTWSYHLPTVLVARMPLSQLPWRRASEMQQRQQTEARARSTPTSRGKPDG